MSEPVALVSYSGGKDSTATLLLAIERVDKSRIFPVFADTGNEHDEVYKYLDYVEGFTGIKIARLKQDFTGAWSRRVEYVTNGWPKKGVPQEHIDRVLSFLKRGPTGNPFLDLCVIKGRFPSRMMQFCTQSLKKFPLTKYAVELIGAFGSVESWQGVRRDESASRAKLAEREQTPEGFGIYRPILDWNWQDVFALHRKHGIKPNPLYSMGMGRVGCMPCINCRKDELLQIARRFPGVISRVKEWEALVSESAKFGVATFYHDPNGGSDGRGIERIMDWVQTSRGGKQFDLDRSIFAGFDECESAYGLCEIRGENDPV